ncbi:hypothetical protein ACROYT_G036995 [Oculina patagonica]
MADKYDVPSLARECIDFVQAAMNPLNAFDVISIARRFNHQDLEKTCWEVIDYNAQQIVTADSFLEIEPEFLLSFVERPSLRRALSSAFAFAWRLYLIQPLHVRILSSLRYDWIAEMASVSEERWQTNRSTVLERNKFMFNNPVMSDIKFVFPNKQTIPAHKYVLAISSPVFFAMFYGDLAEQGESIDITDFDPDDFLQFLRFLYYDDTNFQNVDRAIQLCYLADKYDVPSLARECVNFVDRIMEPLEALDVIQHAFQLKNQELEEASWEVIDYNAQEILADDSFLEVRHTFLLSFLERSSLRIDEVTLFEAVDRWAARRCEEANKTVDGANKRSVLGEDLLKHFRFSLMSPQGFSDYVEPTEILSKNEALDVFKQFTSVSVPGGIKFSILPRIGNSVPLHSCSLGKSYNNYGTGMRLLKSKRDVAKSWILTFTVNREVTLCGVKIITGTVQKQTSCRVSLSVAGEGQKLAQIRDKELSTENGPWDAYGQIDVFFNRPLRLSEDTCYNIETKTDTTQDDHIFVWSKSFEESLRQKSTVSTNSSTTEKSSILSGHCSWLYTECIPANVPYKGEILSLLFNEEE